jgi:hypothetical protein
VGNYETEVEALIGGERAAGLSVGPSEHAQAWLDNVWRNLLGGEVGAAGLPLNSSSRAVSNALRVKAGSGILFGFTAQTSLADGQFIQLHDVLGGLPASGAVPVWSAAISGYVQATGSGLLAVSFIFPGRFFERGIYIVNSTTQNSYTAGAADTFFDAQFI